jgi:NodT family efflux transporter outer membrane factor (OMF) lipoprotein
MSDTASARASAAIVAALALAGCAVGPDFERPAPPAETRYTAADPTRITAQAGGIGQTLRPGATVPANWWQAFGSAALDDLVATALASSPTLEAARATLAQAAELHAAARGAVYPQVVINGAAVRGNTSTRSASGSLDVFSLGPAVNLTPDLFGATARRVEQAQAQVEVQRAQTAAAALALSGNTVLQSIALASASAQLAAVQDIVALDQRNLELVQVSQEAGKSAQLDVLTAQSQLAADRALLPPLLQQASVARHQLAVLAGRSSAAWAPPEFELGALKLPADLPLVLPSALVRSRPDIVAAEAQLRAANAAIGIAAAQLYPNVSLSASWSALASSPGGLFSGSTNLWALAADLMAPVFSGGTLQAQRAAAIDAYAAQLASYRQIVLQAFGQVADALDALRHDAMLLDAQRRALDTAQATLELTQQSYQAGQASLLQLLDAQRQYQQARLGHARASAQRYADTAQLFVAMGGAVLEPEPPVQARQ